MPAEQQKRVALIIGNNAYVHAAPLRNPVNDAEAIAEVLHRLGFAILTGVDLTGDRMDATLLDYARRIEGADAALLYFAGHGIQVKGQNYLIPVDADIREEFQLKRRAFALNDLLDLMVSNARARSGLVFLDACRDDPFSRSLRSGTIGAERSRYLARSGLAKMQAMQGSFIAFATEPDNVADDGTGDHSPFTEALLQHIETPDISIGDMMIEVRNHVWKATNGRQRPWDQSSLSQRFCFKVSKKPSPLAPSVAILLHAPTTMDRPSLAPVPLPAQAIASIAFADTSPPAGDGAEKRSIDATQASESQGETFTLRRGPKRWALLAVVLVVALSLYGAFETSRRFTETRHLEAEAKRMAEQAKLEAEAAAARERERIERERLAEAARFEEGARLAFEAVQRAEAEAAAAAADAARRRKEEEEEAQKKKKEHEEVRAKALAAAETKRMAEEQQKEQRMALCARAGHFYVKGMRELETGNVIAAREFFRLGADEGLWQSAEALAGTYDPEQLSKFNVVGLQPDIFAAKALYEKARVLGERPLCESGELEKMLSRGADKPDADGDLALFRAAYTSGDGLAYVVIKGAKDERIYRFGDESRSASKKDAGAYTLYTCNERHLFVLQNQEDRGALLRAAVVKFGEPGFLELDAKYVSGCSNPDIKSAIPRN
jgi:hypothetical protein